MQGSLDDIQIGTLRLFCRCAEAGSFAGAAVTAGLTPPAVSRAIDRLEQRLGARLFVRTTRQVRLSDVGHDYYRHCREVLAQLEEAERQLSGQQEVAAGLVRMSMPTSYGHYRILPLLVEFRRRYPQVQLELQVSDHNIDFTQDRFDLAIRARTPPESGLIARKLEDGPLCIVAAPAYLLAYGQPRTLEELSQHECLTFTLPSSGQRIPWNVLVDGKEVEWKVKGAIACTSAFLALITLARHGAGLAQIYRYMVEAELRSGNLIEMLPQHAGATRPFSLLYPQARHMPQRVRVLVDFLLDATEDYRHAAGAEAVK